MFRCDRRRRTRRRRNRVAPHSCRRPHTAGVAGRIPPALLAIAVAVAFVANAYALPEFFLQIHDPNVLAGPLAPDFVETLGNGALAALLGALAGGAVLLCAWRATLRGVSWPLATLAAALCALCVLGRTGLTFDPVAWFGAAVVALVADSNDRRAWYALVPFVLLWAIAENGATVALVITAAATAGAIADRRIEKRDIRGRVFTCIAIAVAALAQPHLSPLRGYGIHWLYLDAFLTGAQRDHFLLLPLNFAGTGVVALAVLAGWYGLRRRARSADAFTFLAFFLLTLCDSRNAPFFGILAAPVIADAIASQGGEPAATFDLTRVLESGTGFVVAALVFVAAVAVAEPRTIALRPSTELPVSLLKRAAASHARVVLCERPRWCDDARHMHLFPVLDDRAGLSTIRNRLAQARISYAHGNWQTAMNAAHVDAVIASAHQPLSTLLSAGGWHQAAHDADRVLFLRVQP